MRPFWKIAGSLAISQTLVWGCLYYSFAKLLPTWERDTDWTTTEIAGGLTVALMVAGLVSPLLGRQIDRQRGSYVLTAGPTVGALCLILLSQTNALWQFYAAYLLMGVALAGSLYEPCFAVLTKTMGVQTRRAITIVTLAAGFASTIAFPSIFYLEQIIGWRQTLWVLAAVVLLVAVPLQWYGSRLAERHAEPPSQRERQPKRSAGFGRNPVFYLLAFVYAAIAFNHSAILNHLLPLLDQRGMSEQNAVLAASMIGPMQVSGRVIMLLLEKRVATVWMFIACFVTILIASVALLASNIALFWVAVFVTFQGAGYGITSIMKPLVTAQFMGNTQFGVIAGWLAIPTGIAGAIAPTAAALILGVSSYNVVIVTGAICVMLGLISLLCAARLSNSARATLETP